MKRLLLIILLIPVLIKALPKDIIDFELEDNSFTTIIKNNNDAITFNLYNNILNTNISEDILNSILEQKISNELPNLNYYYKLKVNASNINNNLYILYNDSWNNNLLSNNNYALKKDPISYYYIIGFKIKYKKNINDNWIYDVPNDNKLLNKSLKQKLSYLLNINESEVIKNYKKLYDFYMLESNTLNIKLDFYLSNSLLDKSIYNIDDLLYFKTKNIKINYYSETNLAFKEINDEPNIIPGLVFVIILLLSTIIIKKKNLINFSP